MARRSSARLRDRTPNATTPKRVSLSHDVSDTIRTPRTLPTKLASLQENDEMPGTFPPSASPKSASMAKPMASGNPATPSRAGAMKPSDREMHPQLHHQTTAKPRDEARHLGFSSMVPHTEPPKHTSRIAALQGTPSKACDRGNDFKPPSYQFTFHREHSLELSPEAKKLMYEKREEAASIRKQMIADGEGFPSIDEVIARKIARPKGRFSQVHSKEFEKMDSIAGHHSTFRLKAPPLIDRETKRDATPEKSLKRSPSKAGLDQLNLTQSCSSWIGSAKPHSTSLGISPFRPTPSNDCNKPSLLERPSPVKRVKRTETDDAATTRPILNDGEEPVSTSPGSTSQPRKTASNSSLVHLTTPTKSSLARTASVKSAKSSKIPGPSTTSAKSPAVLSQKSAIRAGHTGSPALLARSPSKAPLFPQTHVQHAGKSESTVDALLARSPSKPMFSRVIAPGSGVEAQPQIRGPPLLARSPLKAPVSRNEQSAEVETKVAAVPFLARSPAKFSIASEIEATPGKDTASKLLGRFNLLRKSPIKSILRSPQRLYSEDPAKIAAGTHLATPPKHWVKSSAALGSALSSASVSAQKHVDFSSSTKARYDRVQSKTPSKSPTPSPKLGRTMVAAADTEPVSYPDLSAHRATLSPSPQKRRQTSGPLDFTFRAGDQDIVFDRSPDTRPASTKSSRPSTIRVVSFNEAAPVEVTGSKKRKFDFENKVATADEDAHATSDKENAPVLAVAQDDSEAERRPTKRAKQCGSEPNSNEKVAANATIAPPVTRRPTMGVKPKGAKTASPVKRPSTISRARLDTLSQPKRRG